MTLREALTQDALHEVAGLVAGDYVERLRRDIDDRTLTPMEYWILLRGFLSAAWQTYQSVGTLLGGSQSEPLTFQAEVLNRSLFEIFSTVLGLCEQPARASILHRESAKSMAQEYARLAVRYGDIPKWQEYLRVYREQQIDTFARLSLPTSAINDPTLIDDAEWPTPGLSLWGNRKKKIPPFVTGSRRAALKVLYDAHHAHQSTQAHARLTAVALTSMSSAPSAPDANEGDALLFATICFAAICAEIGVAAKYTHPQLVPFWSALRAAHGDANELWSVRYAAALGA